MEKLENELKLSEPRAFLGAASCGNYIFAPGGCDKNNNGSNVIDIFKITDHGIGKVKDHGLALSVGRYGLEMVTTGDYVFAMGGSIGGGYYTDTVDIFKVTDNGTEHITDHGLTLTQGTSGFNTVRCGDYIFAPGCYGVPDGFGRYFTDGFGNVIDIFKVTASGVEKIEDHDLDLSEPRVDFVSASCGNYILVMGGYSIGARRFSDTVDIFKVTESGVEHIKDHGLALSEGRFSLAAASCGNYILAMGGNGIDYNVSDTVDIFKVTESGIEHVTDHGLKLREPRERLTAVSCGNYILALGGWDVGECDIIDIFKVTENGVEKVEDHELKLKEPRSGLAAVSCGKYIFAMGGFAGGTRRSEVVDVFEVTDHGVEKVKNPYNKKNS